MGSESLTRTALRVAFLPATIRRMTDPQADPPDTDRIAEATRCLEAAAAGDAPAAAQLFEMVYDELRRLAASYLQAERSDHTLQPTALAHEAWMRLAAQDATRWRDRAHFLRLAARMMRRILVNHDRDRHRLKRGGRGRRVPLSEELQSAAGDPLDLVALDQALRRLSAVDPRKVEIVNLRLFAGLELQEIAEVVGISLAQVKRDWALAKAWLARELDSEAE